MPRVYVPAPFRWTDGIDYPFGWQDVPDDSKARAMKAASKAFDDEGSAAAAAVASSVSKDGNTPAGYLALVPGNQAAGSGSAKNLIKTAAALVEAYPSALTGRGTLADATMWATAGYMATAAGAGGQIEFPSGALPVRIDLYAYLIHIGIKTAAPGSTTAFLGQGNSGSGAHGLSLRADTAGKVQVLYVSAAGTFQIGTSAGVYFDGADHSLLLAIHPCGYVALFRDGELDSTFNPNNVYPIGAVTETQPFTLGGPAVTSSVAIAGLWRNLHVLQFAALPLNIGAIAKTIAAAPSVPASNALTATATYGLFWAAGQSNESGSGNTPGYTGTVGIPQKDSANGRSIIPGLAKRLADRGVAALWAATAFGTTAATDSWCGRIRTWVSGLNVVSGSYVLSGGTVYKCTNALPFAGQSTTAVAAGTGADGVTWTSLGAPTADDTATLAGTGVYASTSARWDPNGLIALAEAKAAMIRPWVRSMVGLICLGQQDRYCGSTSAQFSDAIQKLATYFAANSADKVLICMTVRSSSTTDYSAANGGGAPNAANTTADAWYNAQLIPGRAAALAALAGNSKITAGWDWATSIGVVANQTYATGIGVKSTDSVHMTDATYETLAAPAVDVALQAIGV